MANSELRINLLSTDKNFLSKSKEKTLNLLLISKYVDIDGSVLLRSFQ